MRFEFAALPWEMLGRRPAMVTLTYPGEWELWVPDARTLVRHREALKERWRRQYGMPIGVWVVEFQRRGAPHLHMYLGLPDEVSDEEYQGLQLRTMQRRRLERQVGSFEARRQVRAPGGEFALWLRTAWWEVVGSELRAHHGRGVDIATAFFSVEAESMANRTRVAEYFWRESGKWSQKQAPEGFGSLKFYGRWGGKAGFAPVLDESELDERTGIELRRVLRRMRLGKLRESAERQGRRLRRAEGKTRGRDGLTVFGVNGRQIAPVLEAWARGVVVEKVPRVPVRMSVPHPRAASERVFELDDIGADHQLSDDEPGWDDAWDGVPVDVREMLEIDAHLDQLERDAEELDAQIDRQIDIQHRRALARLKDQRRYRTRRTERGGGGAGASPPSPPGRPHGPNGRDPIG